MPDTVQKHIDSRGIATVTLDRAHRRNAFDEHLIAELTQAIAECSEASEVRAIVLTGAGESFSAGADLNWMRRTADYSEAANLADAQALAKLMHTLDRSRKPTIAAVNGPAYGGGVGLVACCDIAIAAERAQFCLSEVTLGLIPSVISPYLVAAMGARHARRYFLTAEIISSAKALDIGLVHVTCPDEALGAAVEQIVAALLKGGPKAQAEAKDLVFLVDRPLEDRIVAETAARIARTRASGEGKEGLTAFLDRRTPSWVSARTS